VITFAPVARLLQPDKLIDGWPEWSTRLHSRPVVLAELSGGRSNHSFHLTSDIGHLVLRINGTGSLLPGGGRDNEIGIWQEASKQGIAPPLVFVDTQNQYLVSTYIDNELPPQPQLNPACVDQAFKLLDRCHRLTVKSPTINYVDHIEHYWQIIESGNKPPGQALIKQRKPIQLLLESLLTSNSPTGLCHHDPVIANFVGTPNHLYLIDWEYAANGLQIMDFAALANEWKLDDSTVLQRTKCNPALLTKARRLNQYLCLLWEVAIT